MKWQEGSDSNAQYLSMAVLETAAIPFDDPPMKIFVSVDFVFPRVRFRPQRLAERREHPIIVYEASTKAILLTKWSGGRELHPQSKFHRLQCLLRYTTSPDKLAAEDGF